MTRLVIVALVTGLLGILAGQFVHFDSKPVGVSVGSDTSYCSADLAPHPFTCETAR